MKEGTKEGREKQKVHGGQRQCKKTKNKYIMLGCLEQEGYDDNLKASDGI